MQFIKNKKAGEPMTLSEIIGFLFVIALVVFVLLWDKGLGTQITYIFKYFFQSFI